MRAERLIAAPPAALFRAFTSADEIRRWFSPAHFTTPEATIDPRPGGTFDVCMRAPDGTDYWSRGQFDELHEPDLVAFSAAFVLGGEKKFTAHTRVELAPQVGGTLVVVRQDYDLHDEAFRAAVEGAPEGWRTTLDKLERYVTA